VTWLGGHANEAVIINTPRPGSSSIGMGSMGSVSNEFKDHLFPIVPAEEALTILQCGNVRATGKNVRSDRISSGTPRHSSNADETLAVIFMLFDPHSSTPIEIVFDTNPAQMHAIPILPADVNVSTRKTTGFSKETAFMAADDHEWLGYLTLADHCLREHSPRLVLVLGRVSTNADEYELENAKNEVFGAMRKVMIGSKVIRAGVIDGQLQVEGALYFGITQAPPGHIEWLGAHPDQHDCLHPNFAEHHRHDVPGSTGILTASHLPVDQEPPGSPSGTAQAVRRRLEAGNQRYLESGRPPLTRWRPEYLPKFKEKGAKAFILAGANGDVRSPEFLFDSSPGDLLVHRTCGAISGRRDGCSLTNLENLVRRNPEVRLLLVVGDVLDPVVGTATAQVQRLANLLRQTNAQMAIDQLGPAVIHAWREAHKMQSSSESTLDDQHQRILVNLATKLHVHYVLERILRDSDFILEQVRTKHIEVEGAVAYADGSIEFIGGHADVQRLLDQRSKVQKHKGRWGLGPARQRR